MNTMALLAIVFMFLALLSYTISIWGVRKTKQPILFQVLLSWVGLIFDTTGTILMALLAGEWHWNIHGITGILGILAMLVNAIWVSIAFNKKQEMITNNYIKYSLILWIIWLISFVTGAFFAM
jgi:uncharacterized repeat protein (TIGR03987 family)